MGTTILPSGEEIHLTPAEILKYLNPDGLRQLMRQERLRWNLKPNKDTDFIDNQRLYKFSGALHNDGCYQLMEIRTYPDGGALAGYAGVYVDSGIFGMLHNLELWDRAMSEISKTKIVNRAMIGAMAKIPGLHGFGLSDRKTMDQDTDNRMAAIVFDPFDGRAYLMTNDDPRYVNNETRSPEDRIPDRAVARMGDIPTRITQLKNDLDFVADPDYRHTDNNFTDSNRFVLDNIDDRTFVYPEIARDASGDLIENYRVGLNGENTYGESDGAGKYNSQPRLGKNPDLGDHGDDLGEGINSHGAGKNFSGVTHPDGYFPGIFRSLEELERVDLVDQLMTPKTHQATPGAKRPTSFYIFDGKWSPTWFDRHMYRDSYLAQPMNPINMEIAMPDSEPVPYGALSQTEDSDYSTAKLHQWRYNRVTLKYNSKDITIRIIEPGEGYRVGDTLRWTFGDDVFLYEVTMVGANGQIMEGNYYSHRERVFEQDPSTHGVGVPFSNMSGVGSGAKLALDCPVTIETIATQIKNNLYAYVDVTPSVRSDNTTPWSDVHMPDSQDGLITIRSTAAGPGYSGINSGRGGPPPSEFTGSSAFHEHGGNATAGVHVHLFRYVIDTMNPTWVIRDGIQVFTGRWVDQGPMGVERPCDIKALLFSNPDTNNFNNYYKFMLDILLDTINRNPDSTMTNSDGSLTIPLFHTGSVDPADDLRYYERRFDPETCKMITVDVTNRVIYVNQSTGVWWSFSETLKVDPNFGYGMRGPGWQPCAGAVTK